MDRVENGMIVAQRRPRPTLEALPDRWASAMQISDNRAQIVNRIGSFERGHIRPTSLKMGQFLSLTLLPWQRRAIGRLGLRDSLDQPRHISAKLGRDQRE